MEIATFFFALCAIAAILAGPLARLAQLQQEEAAFSAANPDRSHEGPKAWMIYVEREVPQGTIIYDIAADRAGADELALQARIAYPESTVRIESPKEQKHHGQ